MGFFSRKKEVENKKPAQFAKCGREGWDIYHHGKLFQMQPAKGNRPRATCSLCPWRRASLQQKEVSSKVTLHTVSPAVFQEEHAATAPRTLLWGCSGGFCKAPLGELGRRQGAGSGWWVAERRTKAFLSPGFLHSPSKLFIFSPFKVIFLKLAMSNAFW